MKKKTIWSLILALAVTLVVTTGCGQQAQGQQSSTDQSLA